MCIIWNIYKYNYLKIIKRVFTEFSTVYVVNFPWTLVIYKTCKKYNCEVFKMILNLSVPYKAKKLSTCWRAICFPNGNPQEDFTPSIFVKKFDSLSSSADEFYSVRLIILCSRSVTLLTFTCEPGCELLLYQLQFRNEEQCGVELKCWPEQI